MKNREFKVFVFGLFLSLGLYLSAAKANFVGNPYLQFGQSTELSELDFIYAAFEFGDTTYNSAAPITHDFTTSDVDTSADTIDFGSNIGFDPYVNLSSSSLGLPVTFSSTGTLPAGLEEGTEYYVSQVSGSEFEVYPKIEENPATRLSYTTPEENIYEAQAFAVQEQKIDFTDTGSGTHTMSSVKTAQIFYDMVDQYEHTPNDVDNRNTWIELRDDAYGTYRKSRVMVRDNNTASYAGFGKVFTLSGDITQRGNLKQATAEKRTIVRSIVGRFPEHSNFGNPKTTLNMPDEVDTGADTLSLGSLNDGDRFKFIINGSGTLPSPLLEDTDYYYSATNDTVHTSSADAIAGTGAIDITTVGSGTATAYATQRVGDGNRHAFLAEITGADEDGSFDANLLTIATEHNFDTDRGVIDYTSDAILITSGAQNGRWPTMQAEKLSRVRLWFPADADPPVRADTGEPMESGIYYFGGGTGTCRQALYDNEADAIADAATNCDVDDSDLAIKFTDDGNGEVQFKYEDEGIMFKYAIDSSIGNGGRPAKKLPKGVHHHVWVADRNDPAESVAVIDYYVDGVFQWRIDTGENKGDTGSSSGTSVNHFILNSIAAHATGQVDVYADYYGSSTGAIGQAEIDDFYSYVSSRFTLDGVKERARNTELVSITGTAAVGETLTADLGTWTGTAPITYTYQWYQDDGTAISGATSSTYTIDAAYEGDTIYVEVVGDNELNLPNTARSLNTATITEALSVPVNTVLPAISGLEQVGQEGTCSTGTWTGLPTPTYSYQWENEGVEISGATSATYTYQATDEGDTLTCVVTATNSEGSATAESAAAGPIAAASSYSDFDDAGTLVDAIHTGRSNLWEDAAETIAATTDVRSIEGILGTSTSLFQGTVSRQGHVGVRTLNSTTAIDMEDADSQNYGSNVDISDSSVYDTSTGVTIAYSFYMDSVQALPFYDYLLDNSDGSAGMGLRANADGFDFFVYGNTEGIILFDNMLSGSLAAGMYHILIEITETTVKVWINGTLTGDTTITALGGIVNTSEDLRFFGEYDNSDFQDGAFGAFLGFDSTLTTEMKNNVMNQLATDFGGTWTNLSFNTYTMPPTKFASNDNHLPTYLRAANAR